MRRQRQHIVGPFRRAEQYAGPQRTIDRVVPPRQRLDPADAMVIDRILRLEHDADLAPVQRQPQVGFQLVGVELAAALLGGKDANAFTPALSRIGQCSPGPPQQLGRIILRPRLRDTASRNQTDQMVARTERPADRLDQLPRQIGRPLRRRRLAGQADQKLRPGDPRDHRMARHAVDNLFDPSRNAPQQRVAHHLAIGRIHAIELADRQQHHRRRQPRPAIQPVQRRLARTQPGQIVAARHILVLRVGQPLHIGRHRAVDEAQMMHQPIARPPRHRMGECRRTPRLHHPLQRVQHRLAFIARQPVDQGRRRRLPRLYPQIAGQTLAQPQPGAVTIHLPIERVAPADALRPLALHRATAQPLDQSLRRCQRRLQQGLRHRRHQKMGRAGIEQLRQRRDRRRIDQHHQRAATRIHRRHQRRDQLGRRPTAHVDQRDLGIAAQKTLRRIRGTPRADRTPAHLLRGTAQGVAVAGRQDEDAALPVRGGLPAHSFIDSLTRRMPLL